MPKPVEIQFVYKKQIGFTVQQKYAFEKLEQCGINVNEFIRIAVREKIKRDWKEIKENKEKIKLPF
jgi:hypothetical protein